MIFVTVLKLFKIRFILLNEKITYQFGFDTIWIHVASVCLQEIN